MRPQLPPLERLMPYLARIDSARIYSNFGPLVLELESRLCTRFGLPVPCVSTASSGTAALVGAILAVAGRARGERPLALLPAYTFVATAIAAELCGYRPYLLDIDSKSWMLDSEQLLRHPMVRRAGVVIPVAAYGQGVPHDPWLAFRDATGVPVVIDGSASFEALVADPGEYLGEIPVTLSFHATKSFSTGEGGCIVSTDAEVALKSAQALNFGFHMTRDSRTPSTNGKLSEYHAAVGLAELDDWNERNASYKAVAALYEESARVAALSDRLVTAPRVATNYILFKCRDSVEAERVKASLRDDRIEFRLWYGTGVRGNAYFAKADADALSVTSTIAPCILGLPVAPDLDRGSVERVVAALRVALTG